MKLRTKIIAIVVVTIALILIVQLRKLCERRNLKTWRKRRESIASQIDSQETIFVSIPSYRESELHGTVLDLFRKAVCPSRIFVGILQHFTPEDERNCCWNGFGKEDEELMALETHIRVITTSKDTDALGPAMARSRIEKSLYRNERYYMMVDPHTHFTADWDESFIHMLKQCLPYSAKPILTMFPDDYNPTTHRSKWLFSKSLLPNAPTKNSQPGLPTFLSSTDFPKDEQHVLPNRDWIFKIISRKYDSQPSRPFPSLFWVPCCSFAFASLIQSVPYPENLPYLFEGEELLMSSLYWTAGWDFFSPTSMIVNHLWSRCSDRVRKNTSTESEEDRTYTFLSRHFGVENNLLGVNGMSSRHGSRTIQSYLQKIGADLVQRRFLNPASVLGTAEEATSEEIVAKFGSLSNYRALKEELERSILRTAGN